MVSTFAAYPLLVLAATIPGAVVHAFHFSSHTQSAVSAGITAVATHTFPPSRPRHWCGFRCEEHETCLTYSVEGDTCRLYAKDELTSAELVAADDEDGSVYQAVPTASFVGNFDATDDPFYAGGTNLFTAAAVGRAGTVYKWKVKCATSGEVWLAMFRRRRSSGDDDTFTVVGKTRVTVSEADVDTVITHSIPRSARFAVQAGDMVGFFHDPSVEVASVRWEVINEGGPVFKPPNDYDNQNLDVGLEIPGWIEKNRDPMPAIAVYIG